MRFIEHMRKDYETGCQEVAKFINQVATIYHKTRFDKVPKFKIIPILFRQ